MNITLPNYFTLVDFHNCSMKEQLKHLLFFVTVVAELRKDMTPRVLAHRLADQNVHMSEEEVAAILGQDTHNFFTSPYTDTRNRSPNEIAYRITDTETRRMIRDANLRFARISSWKKPVNVFLGLIILACLAVLLTIIGYHLSTRSGVDDLSWMQYQERLGVPEASSEERAKYLLYFITEHIKFRDDMTPEVISERLSDVGLGHVSPKAIREYFKSCADAVIPSASRPGAYSIAPGEIERIQSLLGLKLPDQGDSLSLGWIVGHVHITGLVAVVSGLGSLLGVCLGIGYLTGRLSKISADIILQETA